MKPFLPKPSLAAKPLDERLARGPSTAREFSEKCLLGGRKRGFIREQWSPL